VLSRWAAQGEPSIRSSTHFQFSIEGITLALSYERKYPTTGFWIFVCNTSKWEADKWLEQREQELLYKVSEHHRFDFRAGQLKRLAQRKSATTRMTAFS
jgi:hypothetical protein